MDKIGAAAGLIAPVRWTGRKLAALPPELRPVDEAEAYRIQDAVHRRLGKKRIGYKIGATSRVMQDYLQFDHPCSGGMFEGTVARDRARLPRAAFVRVGIECEIAARIARDVTAGPFTAERMAGEVAAWMPSMEIVEDRFGDFRRIDPHTLVADDFFNWGGVLGPEGQASPEAIADMTGTTTINGIVVGTGRGRDVLGHPLNVLAWLAEALVARGTFLRAGEIVTTGSVVETKWMERGDRAVIAITGLGEASLTLV